MTQTFLMKSCALWVPILLCLSCASDSGDVDSEPPEAPSFVVKTCQDGLDLFPERGTDAKTAGEGVVMEWEIDPRPDDLTGFFIYRVLDHPDSAFVKLEVDPERFLEGNPEVFRFEDTDGAIRPTAFWGRRAWYYLRAIDVDENLSQPSDTTSYRLWQSPRVLSSGVEVLQDTLYVQWQYEFFDHFVYGFQGFHLHVASPTGTESQADVEFREGLEPQMSAEIALVDLGLSPGDWRLRIDAIIGYSERDTLGLGRLRNEGGCIHAGSESPWISFTY
jgi:hypothetical protein